MTVPQPASSKIGTASTRLKLEVEEEEEEYFTACVRGIGSSGSGSRK